MTTPDFTLENPEPVAGVTATGLGSTALLGSLSLSVAPEMLKRHNTRKTCAKCSGALKGAGTICKKCERAHYPGVGQLRGLMDRQRIPCACGQTAGYVVDFRPVCSGCRRTLRIADCNHRKDWRERRGLCRECGHEAEEGKKHCSACLNKFSKRAGGKRRAWTSLSRETVAERARKTRAEAAARGICYNCYRAPAAEGKKRCIGCAEKQLIRYRQMKAEGRKPKRIGPTVSDLYGGRADLLTPRGEMGVGTDFESLASITHAYVSNF